MAPKGKGKNKDKSWTSTGDYQTWTPNQAPHKGGKDSKGSGKGKGKGKDKGKANRNWPLEYATQDPKGKPYCRDHVQNRTCPGNCGRSHQCPVLKPDGYPCNGNHPASSCPHLG